MDAEESAFLKQIREAPADDTVRLVYADWLSDQGREPEASFIRDCPELRHTRTYHSRWDWRHSSEGVRFTSFGVPPPFGPLASKILPGQWPRRALDWYTVRRGFLDTVGIQYARDWVRSPKMVTALRRLALRRVVFDSVPQAIQFSGCPGEWFLAGRKGAPRFKIDVTDPLLRMHDAALHLCHKQWPGVEFEYSERLKLRIATDGFVDTGDIW